MDEVIIAAIVFVAAFTQGAVGFGFGLVSMGLLPLAVSELVAIPFVAVYSLLVSLIIVWELRLYLSWRRIRPLLIGVVLGVPLGLLFLGEADPRYIRFALGAFLVVYSLWSLFVAMRIGQRVISDAWGYVAGLVSGVLGAAFNTGGPPLVVYATLKGWDKHAAKSTLQVLFILTSVLALGGHVAAGRMTERVLTLIAFMIPALALGVWVGGRVYDRINQETFRKAMLVLLLIVGLVFVDKALDIL